MIKVYEAPELEITYIASEGIMVGSDTIIDMDGLYGDGTASVSSDNITVIYDAEEDAAAEAWIAENGMGF